MFSFHPYYPHSLYARLGLGLLAAQIFLFVFALPPFQSGIWLLTEQVVFAAFVLAALGALWCGWGVWNRMLLVAYHPVFACLLAWVGWQLVATALAPLPWRSWFGPPETGEGVAWNMALLVMVAMVSAFWQEAKWRRLLLTLAFTSTALQAALYTAFPYNAAYRYVVGSWRPSTWAAFLAFMAGYVWIAWALSGVKRWWQVLLIVAFTGMVLFVSRNVSALVFLGIAMLVSCKALLFSHYRWWGYKLLGGLRFWRGAAMLACVLPLGWIMFSDRFAVFEPVTKTIPALQLLSDKDGSMGSRLYLNQMGAQALRHAPGLWWKGQGWGGFSDVTFAYALAGGTAVYQQGKRQPTSLMVDGYSFHSHNQPLEALLALGLPGLLLWLMIPLVAIACVPGECFWSVVPMLVGLVWLSNDWYELMQCVPFEALALGALCVYPSSNSREVRWGTLVEKLSQLRPPPNLPAIGAGVWTCGFFLTCIVLTWSAAEQKSMMRYEMQLREAAHSKPYTQYEQSWVGSDIAHGGDRLRSSARFYDSWLEAKGALDENDRGWQARFMQAAHQAAELPQTGAGMAALELQLAYELLEKLQSPVMEPLMQVGIDSMPDMVVALAQKAPLRDDLATPFLMNLDHLGDAQHQLAVLNQLLAAAPDHRAALWLLGARLPNEQGRALQRKAVALGVERVYPLTAADIAAFK